MPRPSTVEIDDQVDDASSAVGTEYGSAHSDNFNQEDPHPLPEQFIPPGSSSTQISSDQSQPPPTRFNPEQMNAEPPSHAYNSSAPSAFGHSIANKMEASAGQKPSEVVAGENHNLLNVQVFTEHLARRRFNNKKEYILSVPPNHNTSTPSYSDDSIDDERDQYNQSSFTSEQLSKLLQPKLFVKKNEKALLLPVLKSSAQTYSSGSMEYRVKALVGPDRYRIDALPDTGAKRNFVSQQLVVKLGLVPKVSTKEKFRLPTGATIKSYGTVDVPFTFLGESEQHLLDCCILPKCTQDLILCQAFLKATGTLTKFTHRITKSLRKFTSRLRFNLIENDTCCLQGRFDDIPSLALADTGCDAMLISTNFAKRHSLEIDRDVEHRRIIEYADGSLDITAGIVHSTTWQFRSSWDKIHCNFYVLDGLKADIILSSHFIFEHDVFSQYELDVVDNSLVPEQDFGDLYNIRLISHYSSALQYLETSSIADMNSPGSFSPEAIKAERVRRDLIRDAINALPLDQQDQARIDERNRQEIWDGYRKRHFEREGGITDSTQQVLVVRKQRWWDKGMVWRRLRRRLTK
ncbi:uncharacterized protein BKA55DRAFT_687316 [Fusarium redolens]|uniref:Uncharacterized protein n=1 Tax=Fusarium redolens TaxID=48865 RepID=A0A9P9HL86_FUSRE|nr:uncharacterized protein BKA55DRAFT_687316 [Fusarium redolens]KAH7259028.1 hypothetical protein BKA55DRAFT_687316 [Fusarium redolens]